MTFGRHTDRPRWSGPVAQATFIGAVLAIWYGVGELGLVNRVVLPPLPDVLRALPKVTLAKEFWADVGLTLYECLVAFAIAALCGLVVGYLVGRSQRLTNEFEPLLSSVYAVPIILFFPLFVLLFGMGPPSKIALAVSIAFFPIALNTIAGLSTVNPTLLAAARLMGASRIQLTWNVMLPAALPVIATGLRMGFILSLLGVIGAETIVSTAGLGYRMVVFSEMMDTPSMYAVIVVIITLAALLTGLSSLLERRLQGRMGLEQ